MGEFLKSLVGSVPIVGPIISSAINASQSRKNVRDTIAANKELALLESQKNVEFWNMQNEYNTPFAQMQRFKEAGLNPNLIYGQGSSGNATTLPRYQAPRVDYSGRKAMFQDIPAILSTYQDFQKKSAQIDNLKASTDVKNEEAGIKFAEKIMRQMKANWYQKGRVSQSYEKNGKMYFEMAPAGEVLFDTQLSAQKEKLRQIKNQVDILDKNKALKDLELEWYKWMKGSQIGKTLLPFLRFMLPLAR